MAILDDKAAIIALVKSHDCNVASEIDQTAATYQDLLNIAFKNAKTFDCDTAYLVALAGCMDDTTRMANGIFLNKTGTTITNPVLLINSQYDTININGGGSYEKLMLAAGSTAGQIAVSANTTLEYLVISGASSVTKLSTTTGSCVHVVLIRCCEDNISTLSKIGFGSCVRNIGVDDGAVFGGFECAATDTTLFTLDVTGATIFNEQMYNLNIGWILPAGAEGVKISYRKQGQVDWQTPAMVIADTNVVALITLLQPNTVYDFLIQCRGTDPDLYSAGIIVTGATIPPIDE